MIKYLKPNTFDEHPITLGIAGSVAVSKKPTMTMNMKNSMNFDSKVDLSTLMAVLTFPLISNGDCFGVLQIPLKDGGKVNMGEEGKENIQGLAEFFGKIIELAYNYYKKILI